MRESTDSIRVSTETVPFCSLLYTHGFLLSFLYQQGTIRLRSAESFNLVHCTLDHKRFFCFLLQRYPWRTMVQMDYMYT